jgi:energy-converting hydrogenase Eha subunit E
MCRYTVASLVVLISLHGLVGSGTTDQLVRPLSLMRAVGHLLMVTVFLGIVCRGRGLVSLGCCGTLILEYL